MCAAHELAAQHSHRAPSKKRLTRQRPSAAGLSCHSLPRHADSTTASLRVAVRVCVRCVAG
jgi:hypothetical protein